MIQQTIDVSATSQKALVVQEQRIKAGLKGAYEAGDALRKIRDEELYRSAGFTSFESYLKKKWSLSRSAGYQLIWHANSVDDIGWLQPEDPSFAVELPASERQTRAMEGLTPEEKALVWREAVEESGDPQPDSKVVAKVRERVAGPSKKTPAKIQDQVEAAREAGIIPEGAEVEIEVARQEESADEPEEMEETDEEYLKRLPAYSQLEGPVKERFAIEALAFRKITPSRKSYATEARKVLEKAKKAAKGHIGPWMSRHYRYLTTNGPERWQACGKCNGTGQLAIFGDCPDCRANGFQV